ncbi:MAG: metallophosphoesterase [Frankiales bacterium]|nr:metallophosphoesterase [Frankiales bacterium]
MIPCHPTRRQALGWAAVVAATPLLSAAVDPERAYGAPLVTLPMELELVTLTETSVVLTWYTADPTSPDGLGRFAPAPADTEVLMGTSPASMKQVFHSSTPTPYHYAEIHGLEPGQTYFYVAQSGGIPAAPAKSFTGNVVGTSGPSTLQGLPFVFTTPQPPAGRYLFSLALCNDLHFGEKTAGLITSEGGGLPPGFQQVPGLPPYPEVMAQALMTDTKARGADFLLAAGDLTAEAKPVDVARARAVLNRFGELGADWFVARGNHDRSHSGAAYSHCSGGLGAGAHDCFKDEFYPGEPGWFTAEVSGLRLLGLDTYDKAGNGGDNGSLSAAQWDFVTKTLAANRDQPTLVFGHHPVSVEASLTSLPPVAFDLDVQQGRRLEALYAGSPGVFLHHSGHTHRNRRTTGGDVVFQEVSAVKEYPGGFTLVRVHEGGYATNFYKTRSDLAREWSERTRQEDFSAVPYYVLGTIGDRNSVVARDLSGLRPVRGPGSVAPPTKPTPSHPSGGSLAATGASDVLPWVAAGLAAGAVGARRAHSAAAPAD